MTLILDLPPALEQYLLQEADQRSLSVEELTLDILNTIFVIKEKQTKAINLLQSWIDREDSQEQKETGEYLIHALDQDRISERKLFPIEMKGITW